MDGKITIDGFCTDKHTIISHGGTPDPTAICSLSYRIDRIPETVSLLEQMLHHMRRVEIMECRGGAE